MDRHKQYAPLVTLNKVEDHFAEEAHNHNYYEIIFIREGSGMHVLNGEQFAYTQGNLFVITPADVHRFTTSTPTVFAAIRFTDSFLYEVSGIPKNWSKELEYLISSQSVRHARFSFDKATTRLLRQIYTTVFAAQNDETIIYFQVLSILRVIRKNLISVREAPAKKPDADESKIEQMLAYIHQNIAKPQMLQIGRLAEEFSLSRNYLSTYFRRHVGLSLHQYIDNYRMTLIQNRLTRSEFTVKEIAYDFGFTDESHLNKTFKKYWGKSARAYRLEQAADL